MSSLTVLPTIYGTLVVLTALQRFWELRCARRHQRALCDAVEEREPPSDYRLMVIVHVLWFLGLVLEPLIVQRTAPPWLAAVAAMVFLSGQLLRFWALRTLGVRWNTKVLTPSEEVGEAFVIADGPYRYIRHPNYAAVILEIAALPLVGGAYLTAALFSILNGIILRRRINVEERALFALPNYGATVGKNPRFFPRLLDLTARRTAAY